MRKVTFNQRFLRSLVAAGALSMAAAPQTAWAALALNAAGTSLGFTLTTFASGFSTSSGIGPVGVAQLNNGNIVVANFANQTNYVFADVDGQTVASALFSSVNSNGFTGVGMATIGGITYTVHNSDGTVRIVNLNGSLGSVVSNVLNYNGLAADTLTNSLYVAGPAGVHRIDLGNPNPNTNSSLFAGVGADGITVSPDGHTVYVETSSLIQGFDAVTGALLYTSPVLNAPDGVGIISGGALSGSIVVNSNNGVLQLLNPATNSLVDIASGGARGDIVGFDTSNGTLLLTMGDSVFRLALGGSTIGGGGSSAVPEPATWITLFAGFAMLGWAMRRQRRPASLAEA